MVDTERVPVKVEPEVLAGIEAVRESAIVNMFARKSVISLARSMGYDETADWIEQHPKIYIEGVFASFEVGEGGRDGGV